jgi:cell wall-associated NlpC family hydrolase
VQADAVEQQRQRVEQIADDLDALANQIGVLDEQHAAALDRIDELTVEIQVSQAKVDAQSSQLGQLQGQLASIAIDKFMNGGASVGATPLLGSAATVTDELQRTQLTRVALDQGAGTSDEMELLVQDLGAETQALEARKTEQANLLASLESQQQAGEALTTQYEQQYAAAQTELGNLVAEEQDRRAAAAVAKAQAREAQNQAKAAAATPSRGGGAATPATAVTPSAPAGNNGNDANAGNNGNAGSGGGGASGPVDTAPAPPAAPSVPAPSSMSGIAVSAASSQLGVAYKFAAESPGVAFDCSGLTKYAWGKAGVYIPHQSAAQYGSTPHVPMDQVQPGDLIFYYAPIGHVGIYIGGGSMIHAPAPGKVVSVATVNWNKVVGVSRPG